MSLRTISYGGGVQSTALVVLAAQGVIDYPVALFSNVGDDSEHPDTITYVREVAIPWAAEHGVIIHELHRTMRDGTRRTLMQHMTSQAKSIPIPVRMANGSPGARACTADYKIKVIGKWLKAHGATPDDPATVAIGISVDEIERAKTSDPNPYQTISYPLLDLSMTRADCAETIKRAGLPVPPKSACFFCPFHRPQVWSEMRRDEPDLFDKSVALERNLNARLTARGKTPVYLTRFNKPLDEAIGVAQDQLPWGEGPEGCDEGYCWT